MPTMNVELERFRAHLYHHEGLGVWLDTSRIHAPADFLAELEPRLTRAYDAMLALEAGGMANADEQRMVGHYWLRAPELAPTKEIAEVITGTLARIGSFAAT